MFRNSKKLRIALLLLALGFVAAKTYLTELRTTAWEIPLWVVVYPINGDGSPATDAYIQALDEKAFDPVEDFFSEEARRYALPLDRPVEFKLAPPLHELPPMPPEHGSVLEIAWWSLKLRYWSWRVDNYEGPGMAQLFVVYHDPQLHTQLGHSTGLQKGLVGIVQAFASRRLEGQNNVILAHEFLHMVGATDKYDLSNNLPLYPHGYAEPELSPLYPQTFAELMGGRIPLSRHKAVIPRNLNFVLIGEQTAAEINWIDSGR